MASLSLPRVLQNRKTSLEIEREQFEKAQNVAIHKAINKEESPVKQKHVRSAIIGTFSQQGAHIFWTISLRLPCMADMIVAWKFCHVLHKVLREGHPLCIDHSQKHRKFLEDVGKLWGHLEEGYGKLIKQYTTLLTAKLDFHKRNPRFPGNLNVSTEDLTSICSNNPDICFQLSVEMFDYLDTILDLQQTIFLSKASSMTMQGQCRLAPIIPCIQDASRIYDHNVKILFLLHSCVPYDVLEGHRERFLKQFKLLKLFYQNTNMMHYFKNLITVSPLPDSPPNFQANFNTYVTQEVYVPQEEEELVEANLIDTTDMVPDHPIREISPPAVSPINLDILAERDNIIKSLHQDCDRLKLEIKILYDKGRIETNKLQDEIGVLETKLAIKESELEQERHIKEVATINLIQDEEQRAKEEKFKASYLKLREEHINLLREKAKVDKNLRTMDQKLNELEQVKSTTDKKLEEAQIQYKNIKEELEIIDSQKNKDLFSLQEDRKIYQREIEDLKHSLIEAHNVKVKIQDQLESSLNQSNELSTKYSELLSTLSEEKLQMERDRLNNKSQIENMVLKALEENENIMQHAIHETENPALSGVSCSPDYLCSLTGLCQDSLKMALNISNAQPMDVIVFAHRITHTNALYILQGRATSNLSPDISFGEKMADTCKLLGESVINLLKCMKEKKPTEEAVESALNYLSNVVTLAETISGSVKGETAETLGSMLENELMAMDKAIEEAAKKMQEMLSKSREADSGIKLQVNEKILDSCTNLMQAIRILVQKSKFLQEEIITQGKGTASTKEFYKRNHRWTDGFISAAKAVGIAATFLLSAADKVVRGEGKLEQLVAAAQEISASTAQLVVASRVKANRNSTNLNELSLASKGVTNATGAIVGTVKDCSELMEETKELDVSNLSFHQTKLLEMNAQVRVLELEKELQQERFNLSGLRKRHYQLAGVEEGWNVEETN